MAQDVVIHLPNFSPEFARFASFFHHEKNHHKDIMDTFGVQPLIKYIAQAKIHYF